MDYPNLSRFFPSRKDKRVVRGPSWAAALRLTAVGDLTHEPFTVPLDETLSLRRAFETPA